MKVREHISIMRTMAIRLGIVMGVLFILFFAFSGFMINWLVEYYSVSLFAINPLESIRVQFQIALGLSLLLFLPYLALELYWYAKDEFKLKHIYTKISLAYILAVTGFFLGITVLSKIALSSLSNSSLFAIQWSAMAVITLVLTLGLIVAGAMQLILVIPILVNLGLINKQKYYKKRTLFIFVTLVIVAIATPTTDAISLAVSMLPVVGATELGFLLSRRTEIC